MTGTIADLAIATILFLAIHIIPSSYLRTPIVKAIGVPVYLAGYSLLSAFLLVWMVMAYFAAPYGPVLWELGSWSRYVILILMVPASILFIGPYTGASPTSIGGQKTAKKESARSGLNAITRHPLMWSFIIWSAVHLLNNGDAKSVIFFTGFGGLALAGTWLIDAKRSREMGADWTEYAAHTSNIPFLAILKGKASLSVKALWWRVLIGLVVFVAFYHLHELVIGVSPIPH